MTAMMRVADTVADNVSTDDGVGSRRSSLFAGGRQEGSGPSGAVSPSASKLSAKPPAPPTRKQLAEQAREIGQELDSEQSVYEDWKRFRGAANQELSRPTSAPLTAGRSEFLSETKKNMVSDMRLQLRLQRDERNMELQDRLQHMTRHRDRVSRQKFAAIPVAEAPHRAIKAVRSVAGYDDRSAAAGGRRLIRRVSIVAVWYDSLMRTVPNDAVESKKMQAILDKLYQLATLSKNTASSRHTLLQFFKVLETLKEWEICSPHVCAAVEFVRTRVLDVSEAEFEKWFNESFPSVGRVPSVKEPAAVKSTEEADATEAAERKPETATSTESSALAAPSTLSALMKKPSATAEETKPELKTVMRQRPLTAV